MAIDATTRERLSALLDGELPSDEARFLLRRIEREPELKRLWSEWQLARECLRGRYQVSLPTDFADRVMDRIDQQEDDRLAPRTEAPSWWRGVVGFAVAASVAWLALLGRSPTETTSSVAVPVAQAPSAAKLRLLDGGLPAQTAALGPASGPAWVSALPSASIEAELTRYVRWHHEAAVRSSGAPMLPLVGEIAWSRPPTDPAGSR